MSDSSRLHMSSYSFTQNNEPKNYGSAKNYVQEVGTWYHNSQMWLLCQQMTNQNLLMSQQYATISAWNAAQQVFIV